MVSNQARVVFVALLFMVVSFAGCFGRAPADAGTAESDSDPPGDVGDIVGNGGGSNAGDDGGDDGSGGDNDASSGRLALELFASDFVGPVFAGYPGDGSGDVYVVEQEGIIWQVSAGGERVRPAWLDIEDRVVSGGERGLFGFAFHPDWPDTASLYVHYTDRSGDTVVSEFVGVAAQDEGDVMRVDAASERFILQQEQPFSNHNGGGLAFGPDGYLYVALGDGGSAHDPLGHGQDKDTWLGAVLRIDVDSTPADGASYVVPGDNPFVGRDGADEIWMYGLRNPWRMSFDRETGDLWLGDVGQNEMEEVDVAPAGVGGLNMGWNIWEGTLRHRPGATNGDATFPAAVYELSGGRCAVTGGYVYRGEAIEQLQGVYVFADFCSGEIWGTTRDDAGVWTRFPLLDTDLNISSFGEDGSGELYAMHHGGDVYRFVLD